MGTRPLFLKWTKSKLLVNRDWRGSKSRADAGRDAGS